MRRIFFRQGANKLKKENIKSDHKILWHQVSFGTKILGNTRKYQLIITESKHLLSLGALTDLLLILIQ